MDIGTGIAIAGVWVFAGMNCLSSTTTSFGMYISVLISICITIFLK